MRKRLPRITYGEMRYSRKAGVPREESEAKDCIGYGDLPSRLVMAENPNLFNNLDDPSRELKLEDFGFSMETEPPYPLLSLEKSDIVLDECRAIISEVNELLSTHPEMTKAAAFDRICPFRGSMTQIGFLLL